MSRNFELLRQIGKDEGLFGQRGKDSLPERARDFRSVEVTGQQEDVFQHRPNFGQLAYEESVKLVQRVFVSPNSHAPRTVVFSSVEGHGSSEICCRAGRVLAAQGSGPVCLVDANLRAPSLHKLFGVDNSPGLADAAAKSSSIKEFVKIVDRNLWFVPAGVPPEEAQKLFVSDRLRSRIDEMREEFNYVLIDAPPVSSYGDAVMLGQMADGFILVVEANSTRRETARMAKETLEGSNVKLLGAILNKRTFPVPEALYRKL